MKSIERIILRKRQVLINRSVKMFSNAIREQYLQAIKVVQDYSISQIDEHIRQAIKPDPIELAFSNSYSSASEISMIWRKYLLPQKKDAVDDIYRSVFERSLSNYSKIKAGKRITNITGTTQERIEEVVRGSVLQSTELGLGIEQTQNLILEAIQQDYKDFTPQRARLIAQTEMITASNQAAMEGARSTGMEFRKFWSTSGKGNSRQTHVNCEQESINKNGLKEDQIFESNGLKFPGDPDGPPEEVCNCHCTLLIEIV